VVFRTPTFDTARHHNPRHFKHDSLVTTCLPEDDSNRKRSSHGLGIDTWSVRARTQQYTLQEHRHALWVASETPADDKATRPSNKLALMRSLFSVRNDACEACRIWTLT
jgi:hypothetical protein